MAKRWFTLLAVSRLCTASNVWTVNCAPLTVQRSDPILSPGQPSGHVHAVVGSTAFSRNMTGLDSATIGNATTCDKWTDHSAYWAPNLYQINSDGTFSALPFTGMVAYYQNYTCNYNASSPGICPENRNPAAFPEGLRMIAGDARRRTLNLSDPWQQAVLMEVGNRGEVYGFPKVLDSDRLSGHVRFPSCWDGVNIDSANHKDHVAYPDASMGGTTEGGMCPASHPYAMINMAALFGWDIGNISDPSSLTFAQGDTTAYGFHGDFYMGWQDRDALQQSFANCFTNDYCPWREFGSPDGSDTEPTVRSPETPAPLEDIGDVNPLIALPGNNPLYVAPIVSNVTAVSASITIATSIANASADIAPVSTSIVDDAPSVSVDAVAVSTSSVDLTSDSTSVADDSASTSVDAGSVASTSAIDVSATDSADAGPSSTVAIGTLPARYKLARWQRVQRGTV